MKKIILLMLILIVSSNFVYSAYNDSKLFHLPLTSSSSDVLGNVDFSNAINGGPDFSGGYADFESGGGGTSADGYYSTDGTILSSSDFTLCFTFNAESSTTNMYIWDEAEGSNEGFLVRLNIADSKIGLIDSGVAGHYSTSTYSTSTLYKTCIVYDDTLETYQFWVNGDDWGSGSVVLDTNTDTQTSIGVLDSGSPTYEQGFDGLLYDMCGWTRALTEAEAKTEYNTYGCFGEGVAEQPSLTLSTSLVNNTDNHNLPMINFTYNGTFSGESGSIVNISFYQQGIFNKTLLDVNLSEDNLYNITLPIEFEDYYNISFNASNSEVNASSGVYVYNVDLKDPELEVNSNVVNNSVYYQYINDLVQNFSGSDSNLYAMNVSYIKLNNDGSYNSTLNNSFAENINETIYTMNFSFQAEDFDPGSYRIDGFVWDSHTGEVLKYDINKLDDYSYIYNGVEITSDKKLKADKLKDKYTFEIDKKAWLCYHSENGFEKVKTTNYPGHYVDFEKGVWVDEYEYNFIETIEDNKIKQICFFNDKEEKYISKSIGDLNEESKTWYFNVSGSMKFLAVDDFTNTTINNFTINVIDPSTKDLVQTATTTTGSVYFNLSSGNYWTNITSSIYATNETENITFSSGGNFTYRLRLTNSLYLFVYDEITDELITNVNATIDVINYDNESSTTTTSGGSVFVSGFSPGSYELRYKASGYNTRSYYTTIVGSDSQTIDLYLLNTSQATYTSFVIEDETGNTLEGTTLRAYRHFIDCNCFKIVEMDKSTFNGIATLSLQQQEARYRFDILNTDFSTIIYSSTSDEGYKITTDQYSLTATLLGDTTESFFGTSSLYQNLSWNNNTKSFYLTISDGSGLVDQFCLYVDQYNLGSRDGKTQICSNCLNASSGILACNVSAYVSNGREMIAKGWIHTSTEYSEYWINPLSIFTDLEAVAVFGVYGVFLGFLIVITMFFAGLVIAGFGGSIIMFDIGLIFISVLELIKISFPILLGFVAISILILNLLGDR